jgi:hypothetical protein
MTQATLHGYRLAAICRNSEAALDLLNLLDRQSDSFRDCVFAQAEIRQPNNRVLNRVAVELQPMPDIEPNGISK